MKTIHSIIAAVAFFGALATVADAQTTKPGATNQIATISLPAEGDRAIRKALAGYEAAWNSHDMKALGELIREDAEFINMVGKHWRGRVDIAATHGPSTKRCSRTPDQRLEG